MKAQMGADVFILPLTSDIDLLVPQTWMVHQLPKPRPGCLNPSMHHYIADWVNPSHSGRLWNISPPPEFDPQTA